MGIYSNADPYLNIHPPTNSTVEITTIKGQKGTPGEKGSQGQHGRVTRIILAISNRHPSQLEGPRIVENWDYPSVPNTFLKVNPGESVVYTQDNSIWTYMPGCNAKGWAQTGYVNAEIYTVPGNKGEKGDVGPQGAKGEVGPRGLQGDKGSRGSKGDQGEPGLRGLQGERGFPGTAGIKGLMGRAGVDGTKGEPGVNGVDGQKGEPGVDGVGEPGPKGDTGEKGADGVVPGVEAVPVMIASYDGNKKMITSGYNIDTVLYLEKGFYRFRMANKVQNGENAMSICLAQMTLDNLEAHLQADIVDQTDRTVTVIVRDMNTDERVDAKVNVVTYNP